MKVRHLAVLCILASLVAGCASTSDRAVRNSLGALVTTAPTQPAPGGGSTAPSSCGDPTASLRPAGALPSAGQMPAGTFMRRIQDRGRLIAGVDQNTLLLGYLNPFDGRIEGFEIDILHQVAKAIFGDPNRIEFKAVVSANRIPVLQNQSVDIVADAMTINCDRLKQVSFSTVYYNAGQRVLVPSNSPVRGIQDLGGKKVCATAGSTSIENIRTAPSHPIPYPVAARTDCLVALQQGDVAAASTDDSILLGFAAQDPNTKIVGAPFSSEPYGIAINKAHPDFVRFVNGVLDGMRADGTWSAIYAKWLGRVAHGPTPAPPQPRYRG